MNNRYTFSILAIVSVLFFLTACAHLQENSMSEESLRERVQMAWKAKKDQNWSKVYDLTVKDFQKKVDRASFGKQSNLSIKDFKIEKISIIEPGNKAKVNIRFMVRHMGIDFPFINAQEEWLWEDGCWKLNLGADKTSSVPTGK